MGQRQSTNNAAQDEAPAKADYYDLLGVERTATDDEIKKGYRRKALELHPDRNYGNVEEATRLFAQVQSAYEVLADPQERAWYDSHRDILLRGDQATGPSAGEFSYNMRMTTTEEVLKLMMKFNGRVEFSDAPSGFFGGLHEFFKQLSKEEDIVRQWENEDPLEYPEFGHKADEYEEVVRPFYAAWTGFATRKSYSWKDEYRLSDAPDRRIRRLMEKENKKIRDEAIQEYNEAVRSLIAFVRKRDPRVQNNQKSEAERQKALREVATAQAARSRAARQAELQDAGADAIPEWAKSRTKEEYEGGFSSESEVEEHEWDCVVCDKTFKSEAQFKAHEKSKKHVRGLKQLKKELHDEGTEIGRANGHTTPAAEAEGREATREVEPVQEAGQPRAQRDDALEDVQEHTKAESKSNGRAREDDEPETSDPSSPSIDNDYAPRSDIEQRLAEEPEPVERASAALDDLGLSGTPATSDPEESALPKLGKAKQKRAKKAGQQAPVNRCLICNAAFPSKNQLMRHIEEEEHAAQPTQVKGPNGGKGRKKK